MDDFCNEASYTLFNTLASRIRLAIIDTLRAGSLDLADLAEFLGQKEEVIADNLKHLVTCALVISKENEKGTNYSLNKEIVEPLTHLISSHISKHCPNMTTCIPQEKLREYMKTEAAKKLYLERE